MADAFVVVGAVDGVAGVDGHLLHAAPVPAASALVVGARRSPGPDQHPPPPAAAGSRLLLRVQRRPTTSCSRRRRRRQCFSTRSPTKSLHIVVQMCVGVRPGMDLLSNEPALNIAFCKYMDMMGGIVTCSCPV